MTNPDDPEFGKDEWDTGDEEDDDDEPTTDEEEGSVQEDEAEGVFGGRTPIRVGTVGLGRQDAAWVAVQMLVYQADDPPRLRSML